MNLILGALLAASLHAAPARLAFNGVTGDGRACRVQYALDADYNVASIAVEGHYNENNDGFKGRLDNYKRKLDQLMDRYEIYRKNFEPTGPLAYSTEPKAERVAGPLHMEQTHEHILSDGRFGAWGGGVTLAAAEGKRDRYSFWTVGKRLDEPSRAILTYRVTEMNKYLLTNTLYTRTIDCQQLKPVPNSEREI